MHEATAENTTKPNGAPAADLKKRATRTLNRVIGQATDLRATTAILDAALEGPRKVDMSDVRIVTINLKTDMQVLNDMIDDYCEILNEADEAEEDRPAAQEAGIRRDDVLDMVLAMMMQVEGLTADADILHKFEGDEDLPGVRYQAIDRMRNVLPKLHSALNDTWMRVRDAVIEDEKQASNGHAGATEPPAAPRKTGRRANHARANGTMEGHANGR